LTRIHFGWSSSKWRRHAAAVSLHGHTCYSRENLSFIGAWLRSATVCGPLLRRTKRDLSFPNFWWTPPLSPSACFHIEAAQIEGCLDARPLVSITDHDEIGACRILQTMLGPHTPVSIEWSVPLGPSFVHIGIHNLPTASAESMFHFMRQYTAHPCPALLSELLSWINESPATLVVLNHPLWDEAHIGAAAHQNMVRALLARHSGQIHALELNGLRSCKENAAVLALSEESGLPAVSGGDRHGTEPGACVNLTNAVSFAEFTAEVRRYKRSTVLFMPRYAVPHSRRQIEAAWDLMRDYPEYPERRRWTDRAFVNDADGTARSLSTLWHSGEPWPARACYRLLRHLGGGPSARLLSAPGLTARLFGPRRPPLAS